MPGRTDESRGSWLRERVCGGARDMLRREEIIEDYPAEEKKALGSRITVRHDTHRCASQASLP
jgi:hypothetical protein